MWGVLENEFNFQTGDVQVNHLRFMGCKRGIVPLSTTHIIVRGSKKLTNLVLKKDLLDNLVPKTVVFF